MRRVEVLLEKRLIYLTGVQISASHPLSDSPGGINNLRSPTVSQGQIQEVLIVVFSSYLNPRSYLLKEWARRDRENPMLGEGFTFLMTNFGDKRYILGVDPEKGVNLRGLGALLIEKEAEMREKLQRPLTYQWYDGNCPFFNFRIVVSPQDDSSLIHEEIVDTVLAFSQGLEKK